ncbi:MAG: ABC transporter permease [Erysipelotrichales bacterium]
MKFYDRAFKSIFRQKNKSIILLLVSFVLGSGIIISFLIQSAISEATNVMINRANTAISLPLGSNLKEDTVDQIGQSTYIKYYDYNINSLVNSDSLTHYEGDVKKYIKGSQKLEDYFDSNFKITGVNNPELLIAKEGKAELIAGRYFNKNEIKQSSNSVIISKEFALKNKLRVDSTFDVSASIQSDSSTLTRGYGLKVVGIIDIANKQLNNSNLELEVNKANIQNTIFAPNSITKTINEFIASGGSNSQLATNTTTPVFIINDPHNLKDFIEEEKGKLPPGVSFISDYDNIKSSIETTAILNSIALLSFVAMTSLTIIVLALVVILFLIDRKKEFGIYKSLGEKKQKTIGQILIETCLIGLTGFIIAISSSSIIAQKVSTTFLSKTSIEHKEKDAADISEIVPYVQYSSIDDNFIANNYQVRITVNNILYILLIGTSTLVVASIGPSIYILRLNPKEILM